MKKKFNSMWRVAIVLVMALSLGLVMAAPVSADVSTPTVDVDPNLIDTVAEYTIGFETGAGGGLTMNVGTITVTFPTGTVVPTSYDTGDITVNGADVAGTAISVAGKAVTITTPVSISASSPVEVIFTTAAGIKNPASEGDKNLTVATSKEANPVTSVTYTIIGLPTVANLYPDKGNMGDTMWVEVEGTNFIGDGDTNESNTSLNFGAGITVVSTKYIGDTEIDCQITINATGTPTVVAATPAGQGTVGTTFTATAAGTEQVDVWDAYDITATTFDTNTLIFQEKTATITAAVNSGTTTGSETLIVHAADYDSETLPITIADADLTLKSLSGAASTTIDCLGTGSGILISATFSGVTVDGFTVKDALSSGYAIRVEGANAIVENNIITAAEGWPMGIDILGVGAGGAEVSGNQLDINNTMMVRGASNVMLEDNIFGAGINLENASDIDIIDNDLTGSEQIGIRFQGSGTFSTVLIEGNTISQVTASTNALDAGIGFLDGSPTVSNLSIIDNSITNNQVPGIVIPDAGSFTNVVVKYNDISGNADYGIKNNKTGLSVEAKYNWWGDIGGPGGEGLGGGDDVSTNVNYDPWLTETRAKTITDGIAYHADTMPLQKGWNTLSVPLKLKDSANTMADIMALGDFLTATNWVIAYQYNPALPGWENIGTSAITLVPCRGYYIKTLETVSFPVLYSGQLGLPALTLPAGWNLIGSGFGIDKVAEGGPSGEEDSSPGDYGIALLDPALPSPPLDYEALKSAVVALDSIRAKCSVVVSPTMPGQTVAWAEIVTTERPMFIGEAYWVFMTDSATLAGFEVTPIYWVDLP